MVRGDAGASSAPRASWEPVPGDVADGRHRGELAVAGELRQRQALDAVRVDVRLLERVDRADEVVDQGPQPLREGADLGAVDQRELTQGRGQQHRAAGEGSPQMAAAAELTVPLDVSVGTGASWHAAAH